MATRNPANSPVEVGSWHPIVRDGFGKQPKDGWPWDFWNISSLTDMEDPGSPPRSCLYVVVGEETLSWKVKVKALKDF